MKIGEIGRCCSLFPYVLHAFQKKTQKTSQHDIELAHKRYKQIGE
ncbi:MAG: type II toxin-antitoxin system RelE/ParE family toxin [Smithella sp.]